MVVKAATSILMGAKVFEVPFVQNLQNSFRCLLFFFFRIPIGLCTILIKNVSATFCAQFQTTALKHKKYLRQNLYAYQNKVTS